jgi:hypothetical protein
MNPYIYIILNLLGGLTQAQLSMLLILYRDSVRRGLRKEVKDTLKPQIRVQADVEAVGDVSLELADGFILSLKDVLYVPSLQRNLISVSCLDNDGLDYYFRDGKCEILCNNECVGLAFQKEDLYLLSLHENVNSVCDVDENVSSSVNANRK